MQILTLAINPHQPLRDAHDPFYPLYRRKARPLQQADRVKNSISVKNPPAGLMALAAVQAAPPALVRRQAQCRQAFSLAAVVMMLSAARQCAKVEARFIQ